jgi:hypothetical protein
MVRAGLQTGPNSGDRRMQTLPFLVLAPAILIGSATSVLGQSKDAPQPVDRYGDPLPAGASARLGTLRFRSADGFQSLAYTPDGRHLVSGGWGGARVFDAATGQLVGRLGADLPQPSEPADLSPDGKFIAVGGWAQDMGGGAVYELISGKQLYRFGTAGATQSGKFSPDGKILA